MYMAYIGSA